MDSGIEIEKTMSDLNDLYHQLIIDHGRNPRHFGRLEMPTHTHEGYNPLCGDRLTVFFQEKNGVITDARFEGSGCAISMASASLMMEALKGKSIQAAEILFSQFHDLVTGTKREAAQLGKLAVLAGVAEYPARVKCATLCWHTALAALHHNTTTLVKTE
ncbi:IscU [Coxiella burnetii CbuK_Q154]|nr:IscU [Coxiella burnetii CbuK_Q154]PHH57782.1 SUF system NifU family Fe-S cluster assembly protein [Coxiella burnetii]